MTKVMPDLSQFYGSEQFYANTLAGRNFLNTEGIQYLATELGAFWLIDLCMSHQLTPKVRNEPFQLWSLELDGKGGCVVECRPDSDMEPVARQEVEYTDFPENFKWYVCDNGQGKTMLLRSEY